MSRLVGFEDSVKQISANDTGLVWGISASLRSEFQHRK